MGRLPITPDFEALTPPVPSGFRGCHPDFEPRITREEARARRERRPRAAQPLLSASGFRAPNGIKATRTRTGLDVSARGASATLPLGAWARVVFARKGKALGDDLKAQVHSDGEWDSFFGDLMAELVPTEALVAYAGDEDWRSSSLYSDLAVRFYVLEGAPASVARALADGAGAPLSALACAIAENGFHRDAWRVAAQGNRVQLTADLYFGDYGGRAHVDLRAIALAADAATPLTLLVACLYEGSFHEKSCAKLAASSN